MIDKVKAMLIHIAKHKGYYDQSYKNFLVTPEELEPAIRGLMRDELNRLDPPVWKHDDGKAYYMFEVGKFDKFLNGGRDE